MNCSEKHVALLRGINVGGNASLPMKELIAVCQALGWANVRTLLQTGNVVFESSEKDRILEEMLEQAVSREFSLNIPVIVRSGKDLAGYLVEVPFPTESQEDPSHLVLYLSKASPLDSAIEGLLSKARSGESVVQYRDAIWIYYPNGIGSSKITPALIDRSIGSPATGRNWSTLRKIHSLCLI